MSTIAKEIKAAIDLANESYAAGYKEGYTAGQRDAVAKCVEIINAHPETKEQAERAANTSGAPHE